MRHRLPALPLRRGPFCAILTLGLAAGLIASGPGLRAAAQEGPGEGGMRLSFGINQRFEADTNPRLRIDNPGTGFTSTTALSLDFRSETRNQSLRLSGSLPLRVLLLPDDDRRFDRGRPDLSFAYSRTAPRSDFSVSGSIRTDDLRFVRPIDLLVPIDPRLPVDPRVPVDPTLPLPDPTDPVDPSLPADPAVPLPPRDLDDLPADDEELDDIELIDGRGTRTLTQLNSQLRLGLGGPVTTTFSLGLRDIRYGGDVNPALSGTRRLTFGSTTALRLTPVTEGTVTLLVERFERDDAAELRRDDRRLIFGIRHEFSETLTADARIGRAWIEAREVDTVRRTVGTDFGLGARLELPRGTLAANAAVATTDDGRRTTGNLTYSHPLPNGALRLAASARRTDDGTRLSFTLGRDMDLRRGPLSASVGLSRGPAGGWGTIGSLTYSEELPRGSFRVSVVQGFTLDAEDQETQRTLASASFTHVINQTSRLNLGAAYSATPTTDNTRLTATYSRDLTRDWSLNLGYRYDNRGRPAGRANSHAVFLTLGRAFDLGL